MKALKTIGIFAALALVGLWAYQMFGLGGNSTDSLLQSVPREEVTRQKVISSLARLRAINFTTTVFTSPVFTSLVDNSRPLSPQPVGRSNPFVEIGTDAPLSPASTAPGSQSTQGSTSAPSEDVSQGESTSVEPQGTGQIFMDDIPQEPEVYEEFEPSF